MPPSWLSGANPALPQGWSMSPGHLGYVSARVSDGFVALADTSGGSHVYTWTGAGYAPPPGEDATLATDAAGLLSLHAPDGVTYGLPDPFIVLATQNPIEYEGTFPLPEAQLDRFMVRLRLGYPARADEIEMLGRQQQTHPLDTLAQVVESDDLIAAQTAVRQVYVDRLIQEYIVTIVEATRQHEDAYLGASPRGSLALYRTAQAQAAVAGRDYVIPDDVKGLAVATLGHRIILRPSARIKNADVGNLINDILRRLPVPGVRAGAR